MSFFYHTLSTAVFTEVPSLVMQIGIHFNSIPSDIRTLYVFKYLSRTLDFLLGIVEMYKNTVIFEVSQALLF